MGAWLFIVCLENLSWTVVLSHVLDSKTVGVFFFSWLHMGELLDEMEMKTK